MASALREMYKEIVDANEDNPDPKGILPAPAVLDGYLAGDRSVRSIPSSDPAIRGSGMKCTTSAAAATSTEWSATGNEVALATSKRAARVRPAAGRSRAGLRRVNAQDGGWLASLDDQAGESAAPAADIDPVQIRRWIEPFQKQFADASGQGSGVGSTA
jgi:hypothetical protein